MDQILTFLSVLQPEKVDGLGHRHHSSGGRGAAGGGPG